MGRILEIADIQYLAIASWEKIYKQQSEKGSINVKDRYIKLLGESLFGIGEIYWHKQTPT